MALFAELHDENKIEPLKYGPKYDQNCKQDILHQECGRNSCLEENAWLLLIMQPW